MARKPYVDQDVCISCQLCVNTVPEVEAQLAQVHHDALARTRRQQVDVGHDEARARPRQPLCRP